MREIDLIPREHVERRRLRRHLKVALAALVAIGVLTCATRIALDFSISRNRPVVEQQRRAMQAAVAQRARIADLEQRKAALEAGLSTLRHLRQPNGWQPALRSLDGAFGPGLWLDQVAFASLSAPDAVPSGRTAGAPPAAPATPDPAVFAHSLEIKGHAVDHATVTTFARALSEQPALHGVRLVDAGLRRYSTTQVVDFTLSAKLAEPSRATP